MKKELQILVDLEVVEVESHQTLEEAMEKGDIPIGWLVNFISDGMADRVAERVALPSQVGDSLRWGEPIMGGIRKWTAS